MITIQEGRKNQERPSRRGPDLFPALQSRQKGLGSQDRNNDQKRVEKRDPLHFQMGGQCAGKEKKNPRQNQPSENGIGPPPDAFNRSHPKQGSHEAVEHSSPTGAIGRAAKAVEKNPDQILISLAPIEQGPYISHAMARKPGLYHGKGHCQEDQPGPKKEFDPLGVI